MRKYVSIFVLCAMSLCTFVGCKSKNAPETFHSDKARPAWTPIDKSDMTSSMTAVVSVDLAAQYPDLAADWRRLDMDLLAAFSGETCLGIASWDEEAGAYMVYIGAPMTGNPSSITFRYYSAYYMNLFEAPNAFEYKNDTSKGTVAEPFVPQFVVSD